MDGKEPGVLEREDQRLDGPRLDTLDMSGWPEEQIATDSARSRPRFTMTGAEASSTTGPAASCDGSVLREVARRLLCHRRSNSSYASWRW
jgi:hypothetical protein